MKSQIDIALEALESAYQQIDYLHGKFTVTGTGNAVMAEIAQALAALQPSSQQTSEGHIHACAPEVADEREAADRTEEDAYVIDRMSKTLAGIAIAIRGPELPLHRHSFHDLPERAQVMALERDLLRLQVAELQARAYLPPQAVEPLQQLYDALIAAGHISDREHINHDELLKLVLHKFAECAQAVEPILDHTTFDERSAIASTLTDDLYNSKDWRDGGIVERIEWLRGMYEDKKVEIAELFAMLEAAEEDRKLLDSGCIMTYERDEFGEHMCERRGLNLRAAIRDAMQKEQGR